MTGVTVTLAGNAGICISAGGENIWVDAPFSGRQPGFSVMDCEGALQGGLPEPDALLFTHCHGDHYSRRWVLRALERFPGLQVYCPQQLPGCHLVAGEEQEWQLGSIRVRFFLLPHEGAQYRAIPHYGILLELQEGCILLPGDCAVAAPELTAAVSGCSVDLAILDFPWLTLSRGRDFLGRLQPKQMLLYHLPFQQDDVNGYRKAALRAAQAYEAGRVGLLMEPWQRESIEI